MNRHFYKSFLPLMFFITSCDRISGEYSFGNNLSLWDNDKKEERVIIYCEGNCRGGIYVVPTYQRHYDSSKHHYAEYVEKAKSNESWVIAKTFRLKEKQENYYIISKDFDITGLDCGKANCESILQSRVMGPMSLTEFQIALRKHKVGLDFR